MFSSRSAAGGIAITIATLLLAIACDAPVPSGKNELAPSSDGAGDTTTKKNKPASEVDDGDDPSGTRRGSSSSSSGSSLPESPSAPDICTKDSECGGIGRICENADCIKGCRTDPECVSGQACIDKVCVTKSTTTPTTPPPGGGNTTTPECTIDEQCVLGKICTSNVCVPGCHSTFDCPFDESCNAAGQCVVLTPTNTGGGTSCGSDGQCNPGNNGSGLICSTTTRTCVPGCRSDIHCPGLEICAAGQCR